MTELTRGQRADFNIYIGQYNRFDLDIRPMLSATYEILGGPSATQIEGRDKLFELIRLYESDPQGIFNELRPDHNPQIINPLNLLLGLRGWIETHGPVPEA